MDDLMSTGTGEYHRLVSSDQDTINAANATARSPCRLAAGSQPSQGCEDGEI
jgi:hypothetical protein